MSHRPLSPPFRAPSPESIILKPLNPYRARRTALSMQSMSRPAAPVVTKTLQSVRSCEQLVTKPSRRISKPERPKPLSISPPPTPRSLPSHKSRLSSAIPYRSPPPSPTVESIPPVPSVPQFVLSPTDKKPVLHIKDVDYSRPQRQTRRLSLHGRRMPCANFLSVQDHATTTRACMV